MITKYAQIAEKDLIMSDEDTEQILKERYELLSNISFAAFTASDCVYVKERDKDYVSSIRDLDMFVQQYIEARNQNRI